MYLKPHHEDISWYMSLHAAKSTLVQKPMPQPKFGDSMTSDCEHIIQRKKANTQRPGVIIQHAYHSAHLLHHLSLVNGTKPGQSRTEMPASLSWSKSQVSGLYFSFWKKVCLQASYITQNPKRQWNPKSSHCPSLTQSLHCLFVFPSHFLAPPLLLIIANTPERIAELLRKRHRSPVIYMD